MFRPIDDPIKNNRKSVGFFSVESLSKKKSNVTQAQIRAINHDTPINIEAESSENRVKAKSKSIVKDAKNLALATSHCLLNPSLRMPFFWGPIYSHLPHVRALNPLGHFYFTGQDADKFTKAAQTTPNSIATFWAGPFPVLYAASNEARHALVRESHVGIVDKASGDYLNWLSGGNNVMCTFPDFRPIDSQAYQTQRRFLMRRFHGGAKLWLTEIEKATASFLQHYSEEHSRSSRTLREFVTALVLHTSSHLLGLTDVTLDNLYFEQAEYRHAIDNVAHYGISERANPTLEKMLYKLFLHAFRSNFDLILDETQDTNLIRNIFFSMDVAFPQAFDDFDKLPKNIRHDIAMNFAATGLGGMVHSTANTLDWAIARLLNDENKLDELIQLLAKHKDLDLTQEDIFDKGGQLFPLCEWVLHNVFLYPPFSHEFFLNRKPFMATLSDKSTIAIQPGSFIVVNYIQCNRSNEKMTSPKTFSESLKEKSTTGRFIIDEKVASFGGSITSKENRKSRVCPGAKTSLYEQMIMIAILLRDYSLEVTNSKEISCDVDVSKYPLCTRLDIGDVTLTELSQFDDDNETLIDQEKQMGQFSINTTSEEDQSIQNKSQVYEPKNTNLNGFFNRIKTVLSPCDANNGVRLLETTLTIGAAFALHNLTM